MKTFNQELKSALVAEIRKHREHDQVIQGAYTDTLSGKFRGCAVGCAIDSLFKVHGHDTPYYLCSDHGIYERELGIPRILAELQDAIHEGLSDESFPTWPERFMEEVPTETDLSKVWPGFTIWLIGDFLAEKQRIVVEQNRADMDKLMRAAANSSGIEIKEQFYEKCAEKLIELLKAEGNV